MAHFPTMSARSASAARRLATIAGLVALAGGCEAWRARKVPDCRAAALRARVASSDAGAGNRAITIALKNTGPASCRLDGYPDVVPLDSAGAPLEEMQVVQSEGTYFEAAARPGRVVVEPGGEGSFQLAFYGPAMGSCVHAARLRLSPPGDSAHTLEVAAPIEACGPRMRVAPVRRGAPEGPLAGPGVRLYLVTPGGVLAVVRPETSEESLLESYGAGRLRRGWVPLANGDSAPGTILFPEDSLRRLEIAWADTAHRRLPRVVRFSGARSDWMVGRGLTLGLSLRDVERLNGGPFTMAGFEWAGEGLVMSWRGGSFNRPPPGAQRVLVRLSPPRDGADATDSASAALVHQLLGDGPYSSTDPRMRRLDPRVVEVAVRYR
jgi:hypothetical protein